MNEFNEQQQAEEQNNPLDRLVSHWLVESKVDYVPYFMALWIAFDAWLRDFKVKETEQDTDELRWERARINYFKTEDSRLSRRFAELLNGTDYESEKFRHNLANLRNHLNQAKIPYSERALKKMELEENEQVWISFEQCILDYPGKGGNLKVGTILVDAPDESAELTEEEYEQELLNIEAGEKQAIQIAPQVFLNPDMQWLFKAYIEMVYQIRNSLFHGYFELTDAAKKAVRYLYITFRMVVVAIKY